MKTPVRTRLLSALLSLVMLVSLLPVSVFAAGPASKSAALVTDASTLKAGDQIILSATANDSTFAAGAMSGKFLSSVETKLDALDKKVEIFTLGGSAGAWTLTASDGKKISAVKAKEMSNSGKGTDTWTIAIDDNGAATIASTNTACGRILYNVRNPRFLNYISDTNVSMLLPSIYKLDTAAARESGIVTDLTTLQNGDKVVVFNPANKKALSSVYNGFYNTGVDVELTGGKLTGYTDAELWTVNRTESGAYTFSTAEGKKLSMDTSYSSTPLDKANVDWALSAAATADCFYIKNVGRGSYLEWFAEKNNWSSYGTIGSNEALFAQQLYLVVDTQEPGQPGQPEDPSAPLKNGDQVVIYNPANLKALSSEYTGFYNKGTDVTLTGGKLAGFTEADIWTVGVNDDGSYTFSTADGKKLSMDEKYSSTPLDKAHTAWTLEQAVTEGCYYIKNVGRNSYLEWYAEKNNWSAFGTIGSNEALFAQAFFKIQKSGIVTSVSDGDQVVVFNPANGKALSTDYTGF